VFQLSRHRLVCENHPDKPWDDEIGCTCGAGLPCECNTGDAPDISQIIEEKNRRGTSLVDPKSVGDL
jgi:hypothetical protein